MRRASHVGWRGMVDGMKGLKAADEGVDAQTQRRQGASLRGKPLAPVARSAPEVGNRDNEHGLALHEEDQAIGEAMDARLANVLARRRVVRDRKRLRVLLERDRHEPHFVRELVAQSRSPFIVPLERGDELALSSRVKDDGSPTQAWRRAR